MAQRALVTLFSRASDFDPSRDALGWAIELTAWEIRSERKRRARARTEPLPERFAELAGADDPEAAATDGELARAVRAALEELDEADRATIEAVLDEARPDGIAQATFRKRKERAMGRLRTMWRVLHGDG